MKVNEVKDIAFNELPEALRQTILEKLKAEGKVPEEKIQHLHFIRRTVSENPQGLNEIIFQLTGCVIETDDWDQKIPNYWHIGKYTDYSAKRKTRQMWGTMFHEEAFLYLKKNLKGFGWNLKYGQIIDGKEYDCIGWKGKICDVHHPDLAIEMHFPMPKKGESYELSHVIEQARKMMEKLRLLKAKHKFILIGIPTNMTADIFGIAHSEVKMMFQRYKLRRLKWLKQRVLDLFCE
jgi:hypothetical protein